MTKPLAMLVAILFLTAAALDKPTTPTSPSLPAKPQKLDNLIVYGDDFSFTAKEPEGWIGDTDNAARICANILFYPKTESYESSPVLVYIAVFDKTDEDMQSNLKADMVKYKSDNPKTIFRDYKVTHPSYKIASEIYQIPGESIEYVSFINPGAKSKLKFSATMNVQKREATPAELKIFQQIVNSLVMLNMKVIAPNGKTNPKPPNR